MGSSQFLYSTVVLEMTALLGYLDIYGKLLTNKVAIVQLNNMPHRKFLNIRFEIECVADFSSLLE